jgi:thiamine biosynthesis protein ThiS
VQVTINGERRGLASTVTIADLVRELGLSERRIAVEVNRQIIARDRYPAHALADGDEVEIVQFVGGG